MVRRWSRRLHSTLAGLALALAATGASIAAVAAAPAGPTPGPAASGSIGLRLVDVPTAASGDPRAQLYIVDHLAPGTVIERRIELSNSTAETTHIIFYPAAATIADGTFVGASGHTPNDLSSWTSVGPDEAEVAAGARLTATVTVAVPDDAAAGERYGVVWAETRVLPVGGSGITHVNRVGIRLYVSVGPGGPPAADFAIDSVDAARTSDGQPLVVASVHNTGGRALDLSGSLQLTDGPGGLRAGPFPAALGTTLAIGATERVTIALDRTLPAGPWDARVTLRSGLVERTAHRTVAFPDASPTRSGAGRLIPALGVLVLLIGLAILVALRRRPHGPLTPRPVTATSPA